MWALLLLSMFANTAPLPQGLYTLDSLIEEARGGLRLKIIDMAKNYRTQVTGSTAIFSSPSSVTCPASQVPLRGNAPLTQIVYKVEKGSFGQQEELTETVTYLGCRGRIFLTEKFITRGLNLQPMGFDAVKNGGRRTYVLGFEEIYRSYEATDDSTNQILAFQIRREGQGMRYNFFSMGNELFWYRELNKPDQHHLLYSRPAGAFRYSRHGSNIGARWGAGSAEVRILSNHSTYYYLAGALVTPLEFQNTFNHLIVEHQLGQTKEIFDLVSQDFPETNFVATGAQTNRMLDELNLIYLRLTTNEDINLVKLQIQEYIDAINSGEIEITDNRPPK